MNREEEGETQNKITNQRNSRCRGALKLQKRFSPHATPPLFILSTSELRRGYVVAAFMTLNSSQANRFMSLVKTVCLLLFTFYIYGCGHEAISHHTIYSGPNWSDTVPVRIISTRCVWVGDGDTLKTADGDDVRLLGINAPEIAHPSRGKLIGERFGEAARDRLAALTMGVSVTLVVPVGRERDAYGRLLALVFVGDSPVRGRESVNEELVRAGMAHVFIMENGGFLNTSAWAAVQREAQGRKLGIWGLVPDQLPALASDTRNEALGAIEEWVRGR